MSEQPDVLEFGKKLGAAVFGEQWFDVVLGTDLLRRDPQPDDDEIIFIRAKTPRGTLMSLALQPREHGIADLTEKQFDECVVQVRETWERAVQNEGKPPQPLEPGLEIGFWYGSQSGTTRYITAPDGSMSAWDSFDDEQCAQWLQGAWERWEKRHAQ